MEATPPKPTLSDLKSALDRLARFNIGNAAMAEGEFLQFIGDLMESPINGADLFAILEEIRVPLNFVEDEMARRYHSKPLVFGEVEELGFQRVLDAWSGMRRAYGLCAQLVNPEPDDPQYKDILATILQRCIYYAGLLIQEHFRARRELPEGLWFDLHGYYATAEEWGVVTLPVADPLDPEQRTTHCMATYVQTLLLDAASPYSHSVRSLNLIRNWLRHWSALVCISTHLPAGKEGLRGVSLVEDFGLHALANSGELDRENYRFLDFSALERQIDLILVQLRQKVSPSRLGLGEESGSVVLNLLEEISRHWIAASSPRRFRRYQAEGSVRLCQGFEAMYFSISGQEFSRPDSAQAYSRGEFEQLYTFRQQVDPSAALSIKESVDYPIDQWSVINHSANGFRLSRSSVGQKLLHDQLIALCPHDGSFFLLGQICWLMQESEGGLVAGVSVLPGRPQGIAIRPLAAPNGPVAPFERGFLLPSVPAIHSGASLVLQAGSYVASRVMEIYQGDVLKRVRLRHLLVRGVDFEQVGFESTDDPV